MTLVLLVPAWLILLGLVVGLCSAARAGDDRLAREQVQGLKLAKAEEHPQPARTQNARPSGAGRGRRSVGNVAA
jgi:hypothetical protein